MTSVTVCRRKSSTQPAIRVTKLVQDGDVKQPEKAGSRVTKEDTFGAYDTIDPALKLCSNFVIADTDRYIRSRASPPGAARRCVYRASTEGVACPSRGARSATLGSGRRHAQAA